MTVKDLKERLVEWPDDMEVRTISMDEYAASYPEAHSLDGIVIDSADDEECGEGERNVGILKTVLVVR